MPAADYRQTIREYILRQAHPRDKFSHQARLYALARRIAARERMVHDDDVLYAAAWMHDLGVFIGHRPEDPAALARWDNIAYVIKTAPAILDQLGFPREKTPAVLEAMRTHLPTEKPTTPEGLLLRDADILEQLGAVGILRTVSKVGRDTRFVLFSDALKVLRRNLEELPALLSLQASRRLAPERTEVLRAFLVAADAEADGVDW